MLRLTGGELRIGLAPSGIGLLHHRGWPRQRSTVLGSGEFSDGAAVSVDELAAQLDALLAASPCRGLPARLVLADAWTRSWMVTPPSNAVRLADCQAAAAARFQTLYGEPPSAWQSAADWHARLPFLASALPAALVTALRRVCAEHRLVLLEIVPQFIAGWNRWCGALEDGAWFGVLQGSTLTLGAVSAGRLCALRSLALPRWAGTDPQWLRQAVQREALRSMLSPPSALALCGDVPAAWIVNAPGDWTCRRLDREFRAETGAAPSSALQLAAMGWP